MKFCVVAIFFCYIYFFLCSQRQIDELQERQRDIGKLLSERKISIGVLPSPDNEELEQTLHKSTTSAEQTLNKLQQHHRNC